MTAHATSDQNPLKRQMLLDEHAIRFLKLKKVAPALLLNRLRARLTLAHQSANSANGRAGQSAAPLVAAARCHVIDPVTAQKVFQSRNAKITDSVRANQSKVRNFHSKNFFFLIPFFQNKTAIPTSRALQNASSVMTGLHGVLAQPLAVLAPASAKRNATANHPTNATAAKFQKVRIRMISSKRASARTLRALAGATGLPGASVQTAAVLTRERGSVPVFARTKTAMKRTMSSRKSARVILACGPAGQNGASASAA